MPSPSPSDSVSAGSRATLPGQTLPALWRAHARTHPSRLAVSHWHEGAITHRYTWGALYDDARRAARWLQQTGVQPGQVCALILPPEPRFFALYMGTMLLGAIPSVLAYPNERLHPDKFRAGLEGMAQRSGLDWLVTEGPLLEHMAAQLSHTSIRMAALDAAWLATTPLDDHDVFAASAVSTCLVQHSSGTTGLQKGVALSHRAIIDHAVRYGAAIGISDRDSVATWLPLYHDMGMIAAFHVPLAFGIPIVQLDAFAWVVRPGELLQAVAAERATLVWLPNFAFNLLADRVRVRDLPPDACASLRLITSCSEPVRQSSIERLIATFGPYGLRATAIGASFAMAETTFAVTQTRLSMPPTVERVSRAAIGTGVARIAEGDEPARECVSSGVPIDGCAVRIVGADGEPLADGAVGGIEVRSVSLFNGYSHNPEATARVFRDGWFVTGDIGYVRGAELFVIGREKDLIIVAGKNIYPEDVEDAVGAVEGVTKGRVVAFEVDDEQRGTGQIGVVVETDETEPATLLALRSRVARVGTDFDVPINHIFFARPRWLIKSSAGKLSRRDNGVRALAELEDLLWKAT